MTLPVGTRLEGAPGSVCEVVGPGWCGPRHEFLKARRGFRNFRYPATGLDEAPPDESLDVLIRRPIGPEPSASFEAERVLTLPDASWFLGVVDRIDAEVRGGVDAPDGPGWLVVADPHAVPRDPTLPADHRPLVRMFFEIPVMLDVLGREGLRTGPLEAADFLIDPDGRWFFLGTDRIGQADTDSGGATPDILHWAALARNWLGRASPDPDQLDWEWLGSLSGRDLEAANALRARVTEVLARVARPRAERRA
jgi:hypothetical protein